MFLFFPSGKRVTPHMASAKEDKSFRLFSKEEGPVDLSGGVLEWIFIWRPWKAALRGWIFFFFIAFSPE
jgi:hypothetical protein